MKRFGASVKGHSQSAWAAEVEKVACDCHMAKFTQNKHLLEYLLSTGTIYLVEASSRDVLWGIGLFLNDPELIKKKIQNGAKMYK